MSVRMTHKASDLTIAVEPAQAQLYKGQGWSASSETPSDKPKPAPKSRAKK